MGQSDWRWHVHAERQALTDIMQVGHGAPRAESSDERWGAHVGPMYASGAWSA